MVRSEHIRMLCFVVFFAPWVLCRCPQAIAQVDDIILRFYSWEARSLASSSPASFFLALIFVLEGSSFEF